jgi:hypothetical protein
MKELVCTVCYEKKLEDMFYKRVEATTGRKSACKKCEGRKYKHKKATPEQNRRRWSVSKDRNPQRLKAKTAVKDALKSGKIVKPAQCSLCGSRRKIEAHHPDYTKPLYVKWWCKKCHTDHHVSIGSYKNVRKEYSRLMRKQPTGPLDPWAWDCEAGERVFQHQAGLNCYFIYDLRESTGAQKRASGELTPILVKKNRQPRKAEKGSDELWRWTD